ncbi:MAG: hypothetical protein ABIL58_22145 [Pseudomonadota bacterium]
MAMSAEINQEIEKRFLEIEAYRSHSLFKEAMIRCRDLAAFIRENDSVLNKRKLLTQLSLKVKEINSGAQTFDAFSETVEMTPKVQKVVSRLFTSGKGGRASTAFETATALLVFGQRTAAMTAFRALLDEDNLRVAAAKSIIRCHLGDGHLKRAVNQYIVWLKADTFPPSHLDSVRSFLQAVLEKKGFRKQLPGPTVGKDTLPELSIEEVPVDYLSIVLPYADKRFRKKQIMLDVNFQRGKMINCIVLKSEEAFIGFLKAGMVFPDVQVNATNMISFCSVRLAEVSKINEGRLKGDTTITMEVMDGASAVS